VGGLRQNEVEGVGAERSPDHIVSIGDDPEVEGLVQIRSLDQGGGHPQEQVVAGLVPHEVRGGGLSEGEGIIETSYEHRATVSQRRRRRTGPEESAGGHATGMTCGFTPGPH
jgi:hypothetical protein